jgi:hypothetical protein
VAADVYHPGFLGPGSYAVLLPQDEEPGRPREREESVASERSDRELTHQHTLSKSMRYQMASDVLSTFRHYDSIRELVLWYNAYIEAGVVPAQLSVDMVNALESVVDKHDLRREAPSAQLIEQVLETTARPFTVSQSLEARDLHILCSGENLRFETIGFLLATAGRSLTFGLAPELFTDPANKDMKIRLTDELLRASTTCLFLTTMVATVNDLTVWLYYENYVFTIMMCGYTGKRQHTSLSRAKLICLCRSAGMETYWGAVNTGVCPWYSPREKANPRAHLASGDPSQDVLCSLQSRQIDIDFHWAANTNQ